MKQCENCALKNSGAIICAVKNLQYELNKSYESLLIPTEEIKCEQYTPIEYLESE